MKERSAELELWVGGVKARLHRSLRTSRLA